MRCKLNDHVIVIAGVAAGASGTIVDVAPEWARRSDLADWVVEFPEPVPCYESWGNTRVTSNLVAYGDDELLPVNPPAAPEQIDTTSDIEAVA